MGVCCWAVELIAHWNQLHHPSIENASTFLRLYAFTRLKSRLVSENAIALIRMMEHSSSDYWWNIFSVNHPLLSILTETKCRKKFNQQLHSSTTFLYAPMFNYSCKHTCIRDDVRNCAIFHVLENQNSFYHFSFNYWLNKWLQSNTPLVVCLRASRDFMNIARGYTLLGCSLQNAWNSRRSMPNTSLNFMQNHQCRMP